MVIGRRGIFVLEKFGEDTFRECSWEVILNLFTHNYMNVYIHLREQKLAT